MNQIYEFITAHGRLSEEHKKQLQENRGFTEETISRNRFFSGGKYLIEAEEELVKRYKQEDLIESGVCIHDGKTINISPMLLEDRVIIPYLNNEKKAYYIRPHKLGLKGVPIEIYQELNAFDRGVILTEGEFKAAAAVQMGVSSIAVPGIGSFSDQHFSRLAKFLNEHKIREICIVFDNEVKDDPKFPDKYKDNPANRYDVQYYAYYMAYRLDKEGFDCRVGWLPDSWRIQGKADIDGALAQGRTKEDLARVVSGSKTYRVFLTDLSKEAQTVIQRKQARRYFKSHVRKEFGKYVASRKRGKAEYDEIISNFTIRVMATHETPEGIVRELCFINEFGQSAPFFAISAEAMYGPDGFGTFCLSRGNYIWRGTKDDLNNIWEDEFLNDDGRHIIEPDHIGWIEEEESWLFGNVLITKEGKELRGDRNHVFWTEKRGIKPVALGISAGRSVISEGIPYLSLSNFDANEARNKLAKTIGDMETNLCLGWASAIVFLEEVFELYGCFPFLFITGRRGSGKSSIAEWLMNFFGLENAGKQCADTTAVAVQRYLAYYSSLPVFLDEYRNTKQVVAKNGFLRNAYNRQSAGKGVKSDFGIREGKIRGTLLLAGEETPEDNALLTRCIMVLIKEANRKENNFNWFMTNRTKFSNHILNLIRNKKELREKFISVLNEGKEYFVKQGADDRTAINYAVACAGYAVSFGDQDLDFARWVTKETIRVKNEYQEEQAVTLFLDDLMVLKTRGLINENYWDHADGRIYLYFHGLYTIWSQEFRKTRGDNPFKSSAIRDYLKEESGFLETNKAWRISGEVKKCVVFDENLAPDSVKSLVARRVPSNSEAAQGSFA